MNNNAWNYYKREIRPAVYKLKEKVWPKPFWYEVWIDLDERFDDEVWPAIKGLPVEAAAKYVLDWLIAQERFYSSPRYYQMLDKLVAYADFQPA